MRALLLLCLLSLATSAEQYTELTLTDGRTLVGWYDEAAEVLRLDGKVKSTLPMPASKIESRKKIAPPVVVAPAPVAVKPEAAPAPVVEVPGPKRPAVDFRVAQAKAIEDAHQARWAPCKALLESSDFLQAVESPTLKGEDLKLMNYGLLCMGGYRRGMLMPTFNRKDEEKIIQLMEELTINFPRFWDLYYANR